MSQQSNKAPAFVTPIAPQSYEKTEEYKSLEEALTGEVKKDKEPEGDPSY